MSGFLLQPHDLFDPLAKAAAARALLYMFECLNRNAALWSGMLLVQTLPYWAAITTSLINTLGKKVLCTD